MRPNIFRRLDLAALATLPLLGIGHVAATAAPPQVNGTTPFGLVRGEATDLTVQGAQLAGNPRLIAPFGFRLEGPPAGSDASNFKLRVVADPRTGPGIYPIRVQTDDGISNPILLSVGQLPVVAEKEDNSTFEAAQPFEAPAVVEGQSGGNDVDFYRFKGAKGQRIVIDALCARIGSGVDPTIRLTTAARGFVAAADDTPGLLTDARLVAVLPEETDYVIEISDSRYQGGGRPIYRLLVGEVPVADEVYPLGGRRGETIGVELRGGTLDGMQAAAATLRPVPGETSQFVRAAAAREPGKPARDVESLPAVLVGDLPELREPADPGAPPLRATAPVVLNGRIDPEGDEDRFTLAVNAGQRYRIEVEAAEAGSALDGVLNVYDVGGKSVANADDTNTPANAAQKQPAMVSADPSLEYNVPSGQSEITIGLKDLQGRGGVGFAYRIVVTPVKPGFAVALNDAQVSIPKGGAAAVGVSLARKGFNGPVTLRVENPPPGLTVCPGLAADGQAVGAFTIAATPDLAPGPYVLDVIGEGAGPDGPIVARASKTIVFASQANLPTNSARQLGLAAAPALEPPVRFEAPEAPVEVVHGYGAPVAIKALRKEGATGVLTFGTLPLPPGLAVPEVKTDDKATEATINVNTTTDHPVGKVSVVLTAKGKLDGADRVLAVPALTLDVIRPAAVELAAAEVEIKAGATVEVKGKVVRKGPFKEPVTVKVNGLPAGVKAEPVTVAPDATEFALTLQAEEKAAAAAAGSSVALAFQVNKKDYPAITAPLAVKVVAAN